MVLTGVGRPGQVGEVVARAFAERGARVALVSRARGEAEERAAAIRGEGRDVRAFTCDLADEAAVAALARDVAGAYDGRIHVLVHMAGGFGASGPVAESDPAVAGRMLAINFTTAYLTTRALLPLLRPARGAIVYFASAAIIPGGRSAGLVGYAAAKSAVASLMRTVAAEERASGVRANALAPNAIRTAANVAAMGEGARYVEREEVAAAVMFLCSDGAASITGQLIALG
ncbi:MAG TPA: SDR family oxidoreductase [Gemmatimonadaceae bacterium]|nr:SDR family oxidoreductase [Gemmatimonadaceae bacterium]